MKDATDLPDADAIADSALERRSRELFSQQVDGLNAGTRSRLNRARQAALAAASGESRSAVGSRWLLPVGGIAALALMTVSAVQLLRAPHDVELAAPANVSVVAPSTADDLEILSSNEELDMLQNVDFYAWLDTQSDLDAAPVANETG